MKKILCILLITATLLSLVSCGDKYAPVESTDEEARVVMTLSLDGEKYEVRYELYRAMFLTYKSSVDGGDNTVWSGADKATYISRIHSIITERITDIYATLHHAGQLGINLYSRDVENQIKEYIKISVEGGIYEGETLQGYKSYMAYLKALAKLGLNYSVQELMLRYTIAIDKINTHYAGEVTDELLDTSLSGGALEYTKEDVESFYYSDESVRYMSAFVQSKYDGALSRATKLRDKMLAVEGNDYSVAIAIISNSISLNEDVERGVVIGRHSLDEETYRDLTDAAFSTPIGKVSNVIEIQTGYDPGFYILYPIAKTAEHFDEAYSEIALVYVGNEIGKILFDVQTALTESAASTELLNSLDYSGITYPSVEIQQ